MAKTVSPVLLYGSEAWVSRLYTLYFLILRVLMDKTVSPVLLYGSEAWVSRLYTLYFLILRVLLAKTVSPCFYCMVVRLGFLVYTHCTFDSEGIVGKNSQPCFIVW